MTPVRCCLLLVVLLFSPVLRAQQPSLIQKLAGRIPQAAFPSCDLVATDTVCYPSKNYICYRATGEGYVQHLLEAALYPNSDATMLLAVSSYRADEQCGFYRSFFYTYNPRTDSLVPKDDTEVLPELYVKQFLPDSTIYKTAAKYLDSVRVNYLSKDATVDDIVHEIYSNRLVFYPGKMRLDVTLSLCDYIPRNVVGFSDADWKLMETAFRPVAFSYNKRLQKFQRR